MQMVIRYYAPHLDEEQHKVIAISTLTLLAGMLAAAESQPSPLREGLLEETKRILKLYAQEYLNTSA
jgi:hypothetical protein